MNSKEDREQELRRLLDSNEGRRVLVSIWNRMNGVPEGSCLPGLPIINEALIDEILTAEFPK